MVTYTKNNNLELWIVGTNYSNYLFELIKHEHVKYFESTLNVVDLFHRCSQTAGILLGRTTIEGWMCGKPGWIYDVDTKGVIKGKTLHEVPNDIEKYYTTNVVKEITQQYTSIIE